MRRRRKLVIAASLLVLASGALIFGAGRYMIAKADGAIYSAAADVAPHSYAIVLGAVVRGGAPSEALADRLDVARELYAAQRVDKLFVSGNGGEDEDGVMARWLVDHGVPADHIVRDPAGFRTRATMENAAALGIHDAVICTQAFHLPRSIAWARAVGIDAVGLEARPQRYPPHLRDDIREAGARTVALLELLVR